MSHHILMEMNPISRFSPAGGDLCRLHHPSHVRIKRRGGPALDPRPILHCQPRGVPICALFLHRLRWWQMHQRQRKYWELPRHLSAVISATMTKRRWGMSSDRSVNRFASLHKPCIWISSEMFVQLWESQLVARLALTLKKEKVWVVSYMNLWVWLGFTYTPHIWVNRHHQHEVNTPVITTVNAVNS